jgi:hypothetical protein
VVPSLGLDDGAGQGAEYPSISIGNFDRLIADLERLWPGQNFPLWLTEFGWQSNPDPSADQYAVSEEDQAEFMTGAIERFATFPRVEAVVWFLARDEPPDPAGVRDTWQSGVRRVNGVHKPSFEAWRRAFGDGGASDDDPLDLFPADAAMLSAERVRGQIAQVAHAAVLQAQDG